MDTSKTPMDDLEEANRRLLECPCLDAEEMKSALLQRGKAVWAVAASPVPDRVDRLRKAVEDGRLIRARLAVFYHDLEVRLARIARAQSAEPQRRELDCIG